MPGNCRSPRRKTHRRLRTPSSAPKWFSLAHHHILSPMHALSAQWWCTTTAPSFANLALLGRQSPRSTTKVCTAATALTWAGKITSMTSTSTKSRSLTSTFKCHRCLKLQFFEKNKKYSSHTSNRGTTRSEIRSLVSQHEHFNRLLNDVRDEQVATSLRELLRDALLHDETNEMPAICAPMRSCGITFVSMAMLLNLRYRHTGHQ